MENKPVVLPPQTLAIAQEAAARAGLSVTDWLSQAIEMRATAEREAATERATRLAEALAATEEALAEIGPIPEEIQREAEEAVERMLAHHAAVVARSRLSESHTDSADAR